MNDKRFRALAFVSALLLLPACGEQTGQMQGYKETKSMVLDILQSEDGKKAIREAQKKAAEEDGMSMLSSGDTQQLQMTVKQVLTDTNHNMLKTMMTDPKFAGDFAKAIKEEHKQLQKDLMKDPEYQQQFIQLMKNPEFETLLMDAMKSTAYRQQTMSIIQEAFQSPLFRAELIQLFKKAIEEESKPKSEQKGGQGSDSSKGGGGTESSQEL